MKAKINVTFFPNGNVEMLRISIYEELWKDYRAFAGRAEKMREKGTPKAEFLARRYERTAALSLFAFLSGVVDHWLKELERKGVVFGGSQNLSDKCDFLFRAVCRPPFAGTAAAYELCRVKTYISRYERDGLALLEHIDGKTLQEMEREMDAYLSFIEKAAALKRFPAPDESTTAFMDRLSTWVKRG